MYSFNRWDFPWISIKKKPSSYWGTPFKEIPRIPRTASNFRSKQSLGLWFEAGRQGPRVGLDGNRNDWSHLVDLSWILYYFCGFISRILYTLVTLDRFEWIFVDV